MTAPHVISFDPGLKGAVAWIMQGYWIMDIVDMPLVANEVNATLIRDLIHGQAEVFGNLPMVAVVERQQAFPKQGATSGFKLGVSYGAILGVVAGLQLPVVIRSSSEWKPRLKLNRDKERSRKAAIERWPDQSERFKLKKHEGRAEAALLGVSYLMESNQGQRDVEAHNAVPPRRRVIRRP